MTFSSPVLPTPPGTVSPITVSWPPPLTAPLNNGLDKDNVWTPPPRSLYASLPLRVTPLPDAAHTPHTVNARAARLQSHATTQKKTAAEVVSDYLINSEDMAMIYVSLDPYATVFKEELDLRKMNLARHPTAGLILFEKDNRILLASMTPGTPGVRIARWQTRIRGAWLIQVDGIPVTSISDAKAVFTRLSCSNSPHCTLQFSHPEVNPDISNKGLPVMSKSDFSQFTHDQLNNRIDLLEDGLRTQRKQQYNIVDSGDVLNYNTRIMKLTRGKLLSQDDRTDWQDSEYLQLDQYDAQGMFGNPVLSQEGDAIFHLVWTYAIKAVTVERKLAASATVRHDLVPYKFSMKLMLTASIRPVLVSSMPLQLLKTC